MPRTLSDAGLTQVIVGLGEARKVLVQRQSSVEQLLAEAEIEHAAVLKSLSGIDAAMELLIAEKRRRDQEAEQGSST